MPRRRCSMTLEAFVLLALTAAPGSDTTPPAAVTFKLASTAFGPGGEIPRKHTCDGVDVSPALSWSGAPAATKSFALIVDDPDAPDPAAPKVVWVHWVAYNLPADVTSLPEGVKPGHLPKGALDGLNDWKLPGWRGPCPPIGEHRYFHRLFALDSKLPDLHRPTKVRLLDAIKGHVLGTAELVGTYEK